MDQLLAGLPAPGSSLTDQPDQSQAEMSHIGSPLTETEDMLFRAISMTNTFHDELDSLSSSELNRNYNIDSVSEDSDEDEDLIQDSEVDSDEKQEMIRMRSTGGNSRKQEAERQERDTTLKKLSERFENLGHQTLASLARQIFSHADNNPAKTITRLILHYYGDRYLRSFLNTHYPNDLYGTFNTAERIQTYIKDTLDAGSDSLRRVRLFSIGHQGSGKSSLLHSMR